MYHIALIQSVVGVLGAEYLINTVYMTVFKPEKRGEICEFVLIASVF